MSNKREQVEALKRQFKSVRVVRETAKETLLQVDHTDQNSGYPLTVYVALDDRFPQTPPTVAYIGGRTVSIAPPDAEEKSAKDVWNPQSSRLVPAVENAFRNLANLWGSAAPPSMGQIKAQLRHLSSDMLQDIVTNSSCRESFAYQLPYLKSLREASQQTTDDIERVATENITLQKDVDQLQKEVKELQQRLAGQVEMMQKARGSMPLLSSVGSPQSLAKTFANDVKILDAECEEIAKKMLAVDSTKERRRFDELLDEFTQKAKSRHMMDLKRRAYYASLNAS